MSDASGELIKVNLGSGPDGPASWRNFDRSPNLVLRRLPFARLLLRKLGVIGPAQLARWSSHVTRRDLTRPLPFDDGTVNAVYSSHFLEHVHLDDARAVLVECHRVLAPGGILRLALPDSGQWARELVAAGDDPTGEAGLRFQEKLGAHPFGRPRGLGRLAFKVGGHIHRWQPTPGLVRSMLMDAGFASDCVTAHEYREGTLPDLMTIESRPESFFLEARR